MKRLIIEDLNILAISKEIRDREMELHILNKEINRIVIVEVKGEVNNYQEINKVGMQEVEDKVRRSKIQKL